jgi:hypothetical protein
MPGNKLETTDRRYASQQNYRITLYNKPSHDNIPLMELHNNQSSNIQKGIVQHNKRNWSHLLEDVLDVQGRTAGPQQWQR